MFRKTVDGCPVVVFGGVEYVAITNILKAVGQSPLLAAWKVRKAMTQCQEAGTEFSIGKIDVVEFLRRVGIKEQEQSYERPRIAASKSGTAAHSMLEAFCLDDKASLAFWKEKLPDQFLAIDDCLVRESITLTHAEKFVFSSERYCARFDACAKTPGGTGPLSFKKTPGLYAEHFLQLAAEFYAEFMVTDEEQEWAPSTCGFLHLQDGRCNYIPVQIDAHKDGLMGALAVFRWKKRMGLLDAGVRT